MSNHTGKKNPYLDFFVVIPAYNEEDIIGKVVKNVINLGFFVIVVDDCSKDDTSLVATKAGALVLPLPVRLGAWGATQTGMRFALSKGAKLIVSFDGDGQHRAEDIAKLIHAYNTKKTNVVIGSYTKRGSFSRQVAWHLFRLITGLKIQDLTSGFRLYDRAATHVLLKREGLLSEFQDIEILLLLRSKGLTVSETPVIILPRTVGKSHIFSSWSKVGYYMIYSFIISCIRR